jgi:hypothetical protein
MRLGIDFGTSHTVGMLDMGGGRVEPLLFRSSPLLPSAVYAADEGLLAGHDAAYGARVEPARYEAHPKRRVDDGTLLLGSAEVPVKQAVAAVLSLIAAEARRVAGAVPDEVVLTHPAGWGNHRRRVLTDAAESAGFGAVTLLAEPVSAAAYFTTVLGHTVAVEQSLVVYDLGGGTFDISVVRRAAGGGWDISATAGLDDVGGVDLDAAVVAWLRTQAPDEEVWARLTSPRSPADRRHRRQLWDDARAAKELLTGAGQVTVAVPLLERDVLLTRDEFETLARPWVERTVTLTTATLFTSGVTAASLAGVFLVGGASRVPLVATMLHRALNVAPVVLDQPELVVARGSLCPLTVPAAAAPVAGPAPTAPEPTTPEPAAPKPIAPKPAAPKEAAREVRAGISVLRPLLVIGGLVWAFAVVFVFLQVGGAFEESSIRYDTMRLAEYAYSGARAPAGPAAFLALLAVPVSVAFMGGSVRRVVGGAAIAAAASTVTFMLGAVDSRRTGYPSDACGIFEMDGFWHHYFDTYGLQHGGGAVISAGGYLAGAMLVVTANVVAVRGRADFGWIGCVGLGGLLAFGCLSAVNDVVLTCERTAGWKPRWGGREFTPVAMFTEGLFGPADRGIGWKLLFVLAFLLGITATLGAAALAGLMVHRLLAGRGRAWLVRGLTAVLLAGGVHVALHAHLEGRAWEQNEHWRAPDAYLAGTHAVWKAVIDRIGPAGFTVCVLVAFHLLLIGAAAWRRGAPPGR